MYLDPGFGSMVIQGFAGVIAVAASSFYIFRQRIKCFFSRDKNAVCQNVNSDEEQNEE
jgi:hypothetical protein